MKKEESHALQGLAVLMMIFHHLFGTDAFLHFPYQTLVGQDALMRMAWFCKLCVATYAFISGYGLERSFKPGVKPYREFILPRMARMVWTYWSVLIVILPVGVLTDYYQGWRPMDFVRVFFWDTAKVGEAHWYVTEYLILLALFPALHWLLEKGEPLLKRRIFLAGAVLALAAVLAVIRWKFWGALDKARVMCVIVFALGMVSARWGVFERLSPARGKALIGLAVLAACVCVRVPIADQASYCRIDNLLILPFLYGCLQILRVLPEAAKRFLAAVSRESTYMWLLHIIMFHLMQEALRLAHFSPLIFLLSAAGTWLVSRLLRMLYEVLGKAIKGRRAAKKGNSSCAL